MKRYCLLTVCLSLLLHPAAQAQIIDHTCTDLTQIPQEYIQQAKDTLHIAYGHTSHGSQLTTGMSSMVGFINGGGLGLSYPQNFFAFNSGGSDGALDLRDTPFSGASDLGNPDRTSWAAATRTYLGSHPEVNVIIWSWCGQVDTSEANIEDYYLDLMTELINDYPDVYFVFMTGHLNGTGADGNVNIRNNQIRDYCRDNNYILYDFADIESYDPDGLVNYMELQCNDNCDYDSDGNGSRDRNWANDWQAAHIEDLDWYSCSSAHSRPLNANRKAYAAWWLWATLAGWNQLGCVDGPSDLSADVDLDNHQVTLNWQDNSNAPDNEDSFIIARQVNGHAWDNNYAIVSADTTTYVDDQLTDGTYRYRVAAHLDDRGDGQPCSSSPTNIATAVLSTASPDAPSNLASTIEGTTVNLTWHDNSDNEQYFVLERATEDGDFEVIDEHIPADSDSYADTGLTPMLTYTYRIMARNAFGDSDYSNETSEYIPESTNTIILESTSEVDDAFLISSSPDTNYGSTNYLSSFDRYIIKFNFPQELTGKTILSANIAFYGWAQSNYQPDQYMQLYRVTAPWQEMQVTWNDALADQPWNYPGGDYDELLGEIELVQGIDHEYYPAVDIVDLLQQWVIGGIDNNGLLLVNESLTGTGLKASEYSTSTILEITYSDRLCYIEGDLNCDGKIDLLDIAKMSKFWLTDESTADIVPPDGDGIVDLPDLLKLIQNWMD